MARKVDRLNDRAVKAAKKGLLADGGGLYLQATNEHAKSWLYRFAKDGKERWMGLGAYPATGLADARRKGQECRKLLDTGIDPLQHRRDAEADARTAARLRAAATRTFKEGAEVYIEAHKAGWRNPKHAKQWMATLETYAFPFIGSMPIGDVDTAAVLKVLQPIWTVKPVTASRVRQRIEKVLQAAKARGDRSGENPAQWRGHLDAILARPSKVHVVQHHEEVPYTGLPALYAELRAKKATSAHALLFTILTAARSNEVRGAMWSEFDLDRRIWSVPASRKKSGIAFRVPLAQEAVAILRELAKERVEGVELVFPGDKANKPMSENTMRKFLQEDMGRAGKTVHGFRASFRDWAAERTNVPREVAERALSHAIKDETEEAYLRGDMLDRRRKLMETWAKYCAATPGNVVVPTRKKAART